MLNLIWFGFFFVAVAFALINAVFFGNSGIFAELMQSTFDMAKLSVDIAIGLAGIMCFWLGIVNIAENAGLADKLSTALSPLFTRLMPEVPRGHPAIASVTMNMSANFLGLDNAATPMGIKAMRDLQSLNHDKTRASNAQILFLVLNTSSVTLFPIAVFMYRAQLGASDPTDVFIPILLATSASTFAGLFAVAIVQRIKLSDTVLLLYFALGASIIAAVVLYFVHLPVAQVASESSLMANAALLSFIMLVLTVGFFKKRDVFSDFIEGAKQGFNLSISILPYLLAMLVAIGLLRASGALDMITQMIGALISSLGGNTDFVDALPTALMKPLSGSGARAMMIETMNMHGVDSFAGRLSAIFQGSTETTFYVLAVYFGAVGIKHSRHAIPCALIADLAGITAAIFIAYLFF